MRVPYVVGKNAIQAYEPSAVTLNLLGELARQLHPDNLNWDAELCPPLVTFCIQALAKNFKNRPVLDELYFADKDNLFELLPTDLPMELIVPLIDTEYYWERCHLAKFGDCGIKRSPGFSWKAQFIQRYMGEVIEQLHPEQNDEDEIGELTAMCNPYIKQLIIKQLRVWQPPLTISKEEWPEIFPHDHIDFMPIFQKLENIVELDIVYGVHNAGDDFNWNMMKVSVDDCKKLGNAILMLNSITIFRLHRSKVEDAHVQALLQGLIQNTTLLELDLSHCSIRDKGALCVAKFLTVHPCLKKLRLCNNRIGGLGGEGLGYALDQEECCPLEHLDLRLNPLEHEGTMGILRCLVRTHKLKELLLAGCYFEDETALRVAQMSFLNASLFKLDVSNNWFDKEAYETMLERFPANRVMEWMDLRATDIPPEVVDKIKKYLVRNRLGLDDIEEDKLQIGGSQEINVEAAEAVDAEEGSEGEEEETEEKVENVENLDVPAEEPAGEDD